jgi:LysM repeat protein
VSASDPKKLFICYRRDDSSDVTGRLYDRLVAKFGSEAIFKDVDSIPLGVDFRTHIDATIKQCSAVVVMIGKRWLEVKNADGRRRIDDERDHVRIEIQSALARDVPLIPLLIHEAHHPRAGDLPAPLEPLAYRNGASLRADPHFHADVNFIIHRLEPVLAPTAPGSEPVNRGEVPAAPRKKPALRNFEPAASLTPTSPLAEAAPPVESLSPSSPEVAAPRASDVSVVAKNAATPPAEIKVLAPPAPPVAKSAAAVRRLGKGRRMLRGAGVVVILAGMSWLGVAYWASREKGTEEERQRQEVRDERARQTFLQLRGEAAARAAQADRIQSLLTEARAADRPETAAKGLAAVLGVLELEPGHAEALALKQKLEAYPRVWRVPGQFKTLAEAVAAAQPGDVIEIAAGVLSDANIALRKPVSIRGAGIDATILRVPGGMLVVGTKGCSLSDLTLEPQPATSETLFLRPPILYIFESDVELTRVKVRKADGNGLGVATPASLRAVDCRFEDNRLTGVYLSGEKAAGRFEGCQITGNGDDGLSAIDGAKVTVANSSARNNRHAGFRFTNAGTTGTLIHSKATANQVGISANEQATVSAEDVTVTDNIKANVEELNAPRVTLLGNNVIGGRAENDASPAEYVIKIGDSGTKIARNLGVTIADLQAANPTVDWGKVTVGQKLNVPVKK